MGFSPEVGRRRGRSPPAPSDRPVAPIRITLARPPMVAQGRAPPMVAVLRSISALTPSRVAKPPLPPAYLRVHDFFRPAPARERHDESHH